MNWDLDAHVDYGAITTVAYFGLAAGADGHLVKTDQKGLTTEYSRWLGSKVTSAINAAHASGDRFVLTVERMAWDDGGQAVTRALLSNPAARTILVSEIVDEMISRGVDGVSLDFEPVLSDQRDNFASFLNELRTGLDAVDPMYQLTFAATGSQPALTYTTFGSAIAAGAADAVIIMGYPLRAIDAKYAGGLAPLYSPTAYDLKQITNAYLKYVAPGGLVMALPWYGRSWPTVTADVNSQVQTDRSLYDRAYNIGYASAISYAAQYGRVVDPAEESAVTVFRWTAGPGCPETWKQIYYDDVETLSFKLDWLMSKNLAGFGMFALGYDDALPDLWQMIRVKYRGLVDATAPIGTIDLATDEHFCLAPRVRVALTADDGSGGSGPAYVRLSNVATRDANGLLSHGRTYPSTAQIMWPLDDPSVGGTSQLGQRAIFAQWRDVFGNWSQPQSVSFALDAVASASVAVAGGANWTRLSSVPVTVNQTGGRTITRVLVSSDPTTGNGVLTKAADAILGEPTMFSLIDPATGGVDTDGERQVYTQWQDTNGCWSAPTATPITLDRTAPTGTFALVGAPKLSTTGTVSVMAPATDALSGVRTLQLSNDGTNWTALAPSADPFDWSAGTTIDGTWTISARWTDAAGNVSAPLTTSLTLDRNGPIGSITLNGGAAYTPSDSVTVNAPAADAASSVVSVRLANDGALTGGVLTNGQPFAAGSPITWPLAGAGTPAGVSDGPHTVYAQWQDSVGNWSSIASATISVDRLPPVVSVPAITLPQGSRLGTKSAVPVLVAWTAQDVGSGVASTTLQTSRNGGTWVEWPHTITASPTTVQADRTASWQVRLSASDLSGNASEPVASLTFRAPVTEDGSSAVRYSGTWKKSSNTSASGGTTHYATGSGATATLAFSGRAVAWVAPLGNSLGKAKVFLDGSLLATIDLQGNAQQRALVFTRSWSVAGAHTVKIKVLGTSGRPRIDVDAFVVLT